MLRHILYGIAIVLLAACSKDPVVTAAALELASDQDSNKKAILTSAEKMQSAFKDGDLDRFISYVHHDVIKLVGGNEKMKDLLRPSVSDFAQQIESTSIEVTDVIIDEKRLVAFVPITRTYQFPEGRINQGSYMIACSSDEGQSWRFMDGQGTKDQEEFFKEKFPSLTSHYPFPACFKRQLKK